MSRSIHNEIIICGDFNLPDVKWDTCSVLGPPHSTDKTLIDYRMFLDLFVTHNLTWLLIDNQVTRSRVAAGKLLTRKLQQSLLEQVLVSDTNIIKHVQLGKPLGKSDHVTITCDMTFTSDSDYLT